MKIVERKTYDIFTDMDEAKLLNIAIVELEEVLKLFDTVKSLLFSDYDDEIFQCNRIEVNREDVRKIRILLEALMANEVEVADY